MPAPPKHTLGADVIRALQRHPKPIRLQQRRKGTGRAAAVTTKTIDLLQGDLCDFAFGEWDGGRLKLLEQEGGDRNGTELQLEMKQMIVSWRC